MREGGRKRKRVYTGPSCCDIFPPSPASSCPPNGGDPVRSTGPFARQRKTHAAFFPGLGDRGRGETPGTQGRRPSPPRRGLLPWESASSEVWKETRRRKGAPLPSSPGPGVPAASQARLPSKEACLAPPQAAGPRSRAPGWSPGSRGAPDGLVDIPPSCSDCSVIITPS